MDINVECQLLGACLLGAQKVEFSFYGIAAHLSHLPEAKEKRFRELTPELFLRGDPKDLKSTLGQIEKVFGKKLNISCDELTEFINSRNLIAHNYYRMSRKGIRDAHQLDNPELFLREFLEECKYWERILNGLLYIMMEGLAERDGRTNEITIDSQQRADMKAYLDHAKTA